MNPKHKRQLLAQLANKGCTNKQNSHHCMYCPIAAPCHKSTLFGNVKAQEIASEELSRIRKLEFLDGLK